ncbi:MAG TPA: hypothetical protein VFC58_06460 [Desulfosporosinus sp.]|nr:hypothetical protein [Desulfosporosinus sp.]
MGAWVGLERFLHLSMGGQVGWSSVANWYQEGVRCLQDVAELKKRWEDLRFVKRAKIC